MKPSEQTSPPVTLDQVKSYWQEHPLLSYELGDLGSEEFFDRFDRIRREDVERFAWGFWEFEAFRGKRILDVGCGPGWLAVNYARAGARVTAIDLTQRAIELTRKHLQYREVHADVQEGNAECLTFGDETFDLVVASGVLHHTPDPEKAFRECHRVLRWGGRAKITLYRKGILLDRWVFGVTRGLMKWIGLRHPGSHLAKEAKDVDDFIRQYDGAQNPLGIGKRDREWRRMLAQAGFTVRGVQVHYFPKRFLPFSSVLPVAVHRLLDRLAGTMAYFNLEKRHPVGRHWQRQAAFYRKAEAKRFQWLTQNRVVARAEAQLLSQVLPLGNGEGRILEVGCGEAANWVTLRRLGARGQYVGFDYFPEKIRFCRRSHRDHAAFLLADGRTTFPFRSGVFDFILLRDLLHHLEASQRKGLIEESFRVLKGGGTLAVVEGNAQNLIGGVYARLFPHERLMRETTASKLERWLKEVAAPFADGVEQRMEEPSAFFRVLLHYRYGIPALARLRPVDAWLKAVTRWSRDRVPLRGWAYSVFRIFKRDD